MKFKQINPCQSYQSNISYISYRLISVIYYKLHHKFVRGYTNDNLNKSSLFIFPHPSPSSTYCPTSWLNWTFCILTLLHHFLMETFFCVVTLPGTSIFTTTPDLIVLWGVFKNLLKAKMIFQNKILWSP